MAKATAAALEPDVGEIREIPDRWGEMSKNAETAQPKTNGSGGGSGGGRGAAARAAAEAAVTRPKPVQAINA